MADQATILVIDDDRDVTEMARLRLSLAGYQVLTANTGTEGLSLAVDQNPDAILLDARMPVTCGLMTLDWLRNHTRTRGIPVIMFSVDRLLRDAATMGGAFSWLDKPYDKQTLLQHVGAAVDASRAHRCRESSLRIDQATHKMHENVHRISRVVDSFAKPRRAKRPRCVTVSQP